MRETFIRVLQLLKRGVLAVLDSWSVLFTGKTRYGTDSLRHSKHPPVEDASKDSSHSYASQTAGPDLEAELQDRLKKADPAVKKIKANLDVLEAMIGRGRSRESAVQERVEALRTKRGDPSGDWEDSLPVVHCPHCHTDEVQPVEALEVVEEQQKSTGPRHYLCLACGLEFSDDREGGSVLTHETVHLNVWIQCWYLMGISTSLTYIASVLGLDRALVQQMVKALGALFSRQESSSEYTKAVRWVSDEQFSQAKKAQKQENLLKHHERLGLETTQESKDTNEHRRQRARRRQPQSTHPPKKNF